MVYYGNVSFILVIKPPWDIVLHRWCVRIQGHHPCPSAGGAVLPCMAQPDLHPVLLLWQAGPLELQRDESFSPCKMRYVESKDLCMYCTIVMLSQCYGALSLNQICEIPRH